LTGADAALLCVAFVADAGVHLLGRELEGLGGNARLLATTVFGGTSASALGHATDLGVAVRTLNPTGSATYQPKLYLGRAGDRISAVVGSANLTRGLVCNVEIGCRLEGEAEDTCLDSLWRWAETQWASTDARPWSAAEVAAPAEALDPDLEALLRQAVAADPVFPTLGPNPSPNLVREVGPGGLYVETPRSRRMGRPAQELPAWMLNLAWSYLKTHGELTNTHLLNELRVHRSSAVCALLQRLPGVHRAPGRPVKLVWRPHAPNG